MVKSIFRAVLAALVLAVAAPASAQDQRQNEPGQFDFYVLALSWSPSFCEAAAERGGLRNASAQCGARPYSFVVHGLWPQYTKGFPEYCHVPAPRLDRGIVSSMLDLMPAPHLIFNEWDRHGTCSGVSPAPAAAARRVRLRRRTRARRVPCRRRGAGSIGTRRDQREDRLLARRSSVPARSA